MNASGPEASRLHSEMEAATYLSVQQRTLQKWRQIGGGPRFVKLGRVVRYRKGDLDEFVAAGERRNTSEAAR
jgi:excisionase family DNA binding protein